VGKRNPQIRKPMTPCERGNWIDTEGTIQSNHQGIFMISVAQAEKQALEDYCRGAVKDGVRCKVIPLRPPPSPMWLARVTGAENVAREISLTLPYIRTEKKLRQIQQFVKNLEKPRRFAPRPSVREAQKIMRQLLRGTL